MKKLLLGLGAIASVAAPVAAVVACGSTTPEKTVDNLAALPKGDASARDISNAFTQSLDFLNETNQSTENELRNFGQFVAYVRDVVSDTADARYLEGTFKSKSEVEQLVGAANISAENLSDAKGIFEAMNLTFVSHKPNPSAPADTYAGKMEEATITGEDERTTIITVLEKINKINPAILKTALLLQIGHVNIGTDTAREFSNNLKDHVLLNDQINAALKAAGFDEETTFVGSKSFSPDPDAAVEKTAFKAGKGYDDAAKLLAELKIIAAK